MKKYSLAMLIVAAGCGEISAGSEATSGTSAALLPGQEFYRIIPPAPVSSGRRARWTRGAPLMPAGYTPRSYYYFYAGDRSNTNVVAAMGFDVVAQQVMF